MRLRPPRSRARDLALVAVLAAGLLLKRVSGAALTDLRATLGLLREDGAAAPVRPAESLASVDDLAGPLRAAGIDVAVAVDGGHGAVPALVGATAYRIVQEALTNVLRHADAHRADVRVAVGPSAVEVEVRDDGRRPGAPVDADVGSGHGLRGMAERAEAVGGTVAAGRGDGGGWRVHALLPLA